MFRTRGKLMLVPGLAGRLRGERRRRRRARADDDEGREQQLPKLEHGEAVEVKEISSEEKETKPPRRYTEGSLLAAMETAGKLVDEEELREAMKDSGIGTPATRAAIIERLIQVGYIERDGRALVVTEKGLNVIRLLGEHPLTSPGLTGDWEHRLAKIETGSDSREAFMGDIVKFTESTVSELDTKLKDVRIPRANLGPCPVCGRDIVENRKGYSCWSREDPGCGFVIWKSKAGKQLPIAVARELIKTGRTEKPVTGFKGRSGRELPRQARAARRPRTASGGSSSTSRGRRRGPSPPRSRRARPKQLEPVAQRLRPAAHAPPRTGACAGPDLIVGDDVSDARTRPRQLGQGGRGPRRLCRGRPSRRAAGRADRAPTPHYYGARGRRAGLRARLGDHVRRARRARSPAAPGTPGAGCRRSSASGCCGASSPRSRSRCWGVGGVGRLRRPRPAS